MTAQTDAPHSHEPDLRQATAPPAALLAVGGLKTPLNEGDASKIIAQLNSRWRVIVDAGKIQWILQHRNATGANAWRGDSYCQTRHRLIFAIRERAGSVR